VAFENKFMFRHFERSVRETFRYAQSPTLVAFLENLVATSCRFVEDLKAETVLYRARLGHGWERGGDKQCDGLDHRRAYRLKEMIPDSRYVVDGRVNAKGIACLYLAEQAETAVLEVRPQSGLYVSLARFRIIHDLRLVDFSKHLVEDMLAMFSPNPTPEQIETRVWMDINSAFSAPVTRADEAVSYIPTQIIAETLKAHGYDGIAYKSGCGGRGRNVALFDIAAAEPLTCAMHQVECSVRLGDGYHPYPINSCGRMDVPPEIAAEELP
jgi:RES domain-containing protein